MLCTIFMKFSAFVAVPCSNKHFKLGDSLKGSKVMGFNLCTSDAKIFPGPRMIPTSFDTITSILGLRLNVSREGGGIVVFFVCHAFEW